MRRIKVLKLGWEFPPLINGGLGVACMGISRALSQKVDLSVIVPKAKPGAKYDGFGLVGINNLEYQEMETLEERFRSRFDWGLIADISAPNYETRMAILQKKIELDHLEIYKIPYEVLDYIATNIKNNIRELEGSLNKLIALHKLKNEEITLLIENDLTDFYYIK